MYGDATTPTRQNGIQCEKLADGTIIPIPGPKIPSLPLRSLTIVYHYVAMAIPDGVATTRVDQA